MSLAAGIARRSMAFATRTARATAKGTMNSLGLITRPGGGFDPDLREYDPSNPTVVYDDPTTPGAGNIAGITVAQGPINMDLGDEPQYYSSIAVYLPSDVPILPMINDLVLVKASPDQPIVGRYFRVLDVPVGGRIDASIDLQCTGIQPSREWSS